MPFTQAYSSSDPNLPSLPIDVVQFQEGYAESVEDDEVTAEKQSKTLASWMMSPFDRHSAVNEVSPKMLGQKWFPNASKHRHQDSNVDPLRRLSVASDQDRLRRLTFVNRAEWEPSTDIDAIPVSQDFNNPLGCQVTIVDYCASKYKLWRLEIYRDDANELYNLLSSRPSWSAVRWISVSGRNAEAIKTIGRFLEIHSLPIKDMLFGEGRRTKAEKYPTHTFCCLPLFKLMDYRPQRTIQKRKLIKFWKNYNRECFVESREAERRQSQASASTQDSANSSSTLKPSTLNLGQRIAQVNPESIYKWSNPEAESAVGSSYLESRRPLSSAGKALGVEQVYLFLTQSGTVVSLFDKGGSRIETPVLARIGASSTILRESSDPSMLLQGILDCMVDEIHPIISEYRKKLDELEIAAVMNPTMGHTQDLHLINAELTILRNSIVPITSVVNSLRDHNLIHDQSQKLSGNSKASIKTDVSELAIVYLSDVADHTMTFTQDLDVMRNNAKSMTELIFNTISIQSSDAVRLLSLVTVVFLPLSFLTGYYGMNFTDFDSLNNNVGYYWAIAVPFCVCLSFVLMWQWVRDKIRTLINSIAKEWQQYKADALEFHRQNKPGTIV